MEVYKRDSQEQQQQQQQLFQYFRTSPFLAGDEVEIRV